MSSKLVVTNLFSFDQDMRIELSILNIPHPCFTEVLILLHNLSPVTYCSSFFACRLLRKDLLEFLAVFVRRLRGVCKPWLWSGEMVYAGDFSLSLTLNLNLTDSPQYYDLPVLESTLQCLVEITAIPGFSRASKLVEPQELCVDILASLLQVSYSCMGFVRYK